MLKNSTYKGNADNCHVESEKSATENIADDAGAAFASSSERKRLDKALPYRRVFIKMDMSDEKLVKRIGGLLGIFNEGTDYAVFFDSSVNDYLRDKTVKFSATDFVVRELREILGDSSVVVR